MPSQTTGVPIICLQGDFVAPNSALALSECINHSALTGHTKFGHRRTTIEVFSQEEYVEHVKYLKGDADV